MRMQRPIITFHIQNYHYELRTRRVAETHRDSNGNTHTTYRTETYWERVNTHRASGDFLYTQWADTSPNPQCLEYVKQFHLTRLRMYKHFDFTSVASVSYAYQEALFIRMHHTDVHYDFHTTQTVPGFRENILLYNDREGNFPWYVKSGVYAFLTLIMLGWIQRIFFIKNSKRVTYNLRKIFIR